jgi:hypothetical protein
MHKLPKVLLLALASGVLAVAVGFLTSTPAPAAPTSVPVTVVNTPSAPVPTAAQGTTAISGNVGISGTPAVSLVPGSKVYVINFPDSEGNPSPLVVRDQTPTQPFHIDLCVDAGSAAGTYCQGVYPFSAGSTAAVPRTTSDGQAVERMVIENITGSCVGFGEAVFSLTLSTTVNENSPVPTLYDIIPVTASASPGLQSISQTTRLYSEPASLLTISPGVTGGPSDGAACEVVLTGYLTTKIP